MNHNLKQIYSIKNTGYVIISRSAFVTLLNMIENHNVISAYGYLLQQAQFGVGYSPHGERLERGELEFSLANFMQYLDCGKTYAYKQLNWLIDNGLLKKMDKRGHRYCLPLYEEHCSNFISRTKAHETTAYVSAEERFDEFFEYYHFTFDIPHRERERARKEWYRLTPEEREQAMEYLETYRDSLARPEHVKLACNYLKDKTFKN